MHALKFFASPFQEKVLQPREALEDTLNNMKSIWKKNSKKKCKALMLEMF
jgi:hypothetical protein